MGFDVSMFEYSVVVFRSLLGTFGDDEDEPTVILEQQHPGLALTEAVSQQWLQQHLCSSDNGEQSWALLAETALISAAAVACLYLSGSTIFFIGVAYTLVLANIPMEMLPLKRKGAYVELAEWAVDIQLPTVLALGYLMFLQSAIVVLASIPLHVLHRFALGSSLMAAVSWAMSAALLTLWAPLQVANWLGLSTAQCATTGAAVLLGCCCPLDALKRPLRRVARGFASLWLWLPLTCAKLAEGFALLPFGMAPFTEHPYWMHWLRWLSYVVFFQAPSWVLQKWGVLIYYFVVSCLFYLVAALYVETLRTIPVMNGLLVNFCAALTLWIVRSLGERSASTCVDKPSG